MVSYLHLGGDTMVPLRSVIAVLDWEVQRAPATREFLDLQRSEGRLVDLSAGRPKSVVVTDGGAFLSAVSVLTLQRRARAVRLDA